MGLYCVLIPPYRCSLTHHEKGAACVAKCQPVTLPKAMFGRKPEIFERLYYHLSNTSQIDKDFQQMTEAMRGAEQEAQVYNGCMSS
jgi:hypothetical protein